MSAFSARFKNTRSNIDFYLKSINKIPVLTREQEQKIAREVRKGNKEALEKLIIYNLKYVVSIANRYRGCSISLLDLINEGNIGLIQAAHRFDPNRGVKFITYAVWWIKQAIMHALADQCGTVRLPLKQAGALYKIGSKIKKLSQILEKEPTCREIAKALDMTEEEVETIMRVYRSYLSLDTPIKDDDDTSHLDIMVGNSFPSAESHLIRKSLAKEMDEILKELPPREEKIIRMRFGFNEDPMTLEKIGKRLGLSRERVRQIEKKAKNRLQARANAKMLRDYLT